MAEVIAERPPTCIECTRWRDNWSCDAFPDGIPDAIILGKRDHREPLKGDHGIQFEPKKQETP